MCALLIGVIRQVLLISLIVQFGGRLECNAAAISNDNEAENCETTKIPTNFQEIAIEFDERGKTGVDIMALADLVMQSDLGSGLSAKLVSSMRKESTWRIPHVKALGEITMQACPAKHVAPEFMNNLMNFLMIYYNNGKENERSAARVAAWDKILGDFAKCKKEFPGPLDYRSKGGLVTEYMGPEDAVKGIQITIDEERADSFRQMDSVMEGLWYMIEVVASSCFESVGGSTSSWLSNYFLNFIIDFTDQFRKWWVAPKDNINYGILFGDVDLYANLYNFRACAVAGFQSLGILDKLPVRPVNIAENN